MSGNNNASSSSTRPRARQKPIPLPADSVLTFTPYHTPVVQRARRRRAVVPLRRLSHAQANYRFIVDGKADIEALSHEEIPWEMVEIVVVPYDGSCSICLCKLSKPFVTKCGHVFDLNCMQDYALAMKENGVRCPLCFRWTYIADMKPCVTVRETVRVGDIVQMKRMGRGVVVNDVREMGVRVGVIGNEKQRGEDNDEEGMFQMVGGGWVFLHSLNEKCARMEGWNEFSGRVVEIGRATGGNGRFAHLVEGCEVTIIEMDIENLSDQVLEIYGEQLAQRRRDRKRRESRGKREERRMQKRQSKVLREYFAREGGREPVEVYDGDLGGFPALNGTEDTQTNEESVEEQREETDMRGWGSYSSVTVNMGAFPELGGMDSTRVETPRGVWGAKNETEQEEGVQGETERGGDRRRRGKMTILSNAQTVRRR